MITTNKQNALSYLLLGSLLPSFLSAYSLRRRAQFSPQYCTPVNDENRRFDSSAFVILELTEDAGSNTRVADATDKTAINDAFTGSYVVNCEYENAERFAENATVLSDALEEENFGTQFDFPRGDFTWLVEVELECNACGSDKPWELFLNDSDKGPQNTNTCHCPGPSQSKFLRNFQQAFENEKSNNNGVARVSILNVTQVPLLNPDQCDTTTTTTYNYNGVCPGRNLRQFFFPDSASPTESPTESPTDNPTDSPTDNPTDSPTESPTKSPTTSSPTVILGKSYCTWTPRPDCYANNGFPRCCSTPGESCPDKPPACDIPTSAPTTVNNGPTTSPTTVNNGPTTSPTGVPATTDTPTDMPILSGVTDTPTDMPILSGVPVPTDTPTGVPATTDAPLTNTPEADPTEAPETNAPMDPSTDEPVAPANTTASRFLMWEDDEEDSDVATKKKEESVNEAAFAYQTERQICSEVDAKLIDNEANRKMCTDYLDLPYIKTNAESCPASAHKVPKKYFSVAKSNEQTIQQVGISAANPEYERHHFGDEEALEYIRKNCGEDAANAYECLSPAAYRADLFRFCALYSEGGVYMDSDMLPLVPLDDLYDPCAVATVGHDWPQGRPQKQMKILAGQKGAPIFECMVNKIVKNVRNRYYPDNPLALTGPMALQECYEVYHHDVSITYHDTRNAAYPHSGMRAGDLLLALETPGATNYKADFDSHEVYRPTCPLHNKNANLKPVKVASA